ncbi:MAG TPA: hypothetical protein VK625_05230 [Flavitalea sp.]|nr:hypothetical protein [Flavitalea sp.]
MKNNRLMKGNALRLLSSALVIALTGFLSGCKDDDPKKEDTPELITKATLVFTPSGGGSTVTVTATDPDGEGVQDIAVDGPINLAANKTYTLAIALINELAAASDPAYNITEEVEGEGDEHLFFFSWTNNVFSDPAGNGNVDNRNDAVNYTGGSNSKDANNRPLGLTTTWASAASTASGSFRVLLKHQPDLKSDTSDSNTGETDLDISFSINVQ